LLMAFKRLNHSLALLHLFCLESSPYQRVYFDV